jgi:hypothetical protein
MRDARCAVQEQVGAVILSREAAKDLLQQRHLICEHLTTRLQPHEIDPAGQVRRIERHGMRPGGHGPID